MHSSTAATSASRLVFHQTGVPADSLQWESFTAPVPGPGEVLVRILAAPINPADLNFVEGTYGVKATLPATPGVEGCGEIVTSESPDFKPGDRAIFLRRAATWATHTVVDADSLFKLPPAIDPLQAAMLKVNPATAWRLLHRAGRPAAGEWVVQNAGNSAVGRCVIQLARSLGIRTVSFVRRPELIPELEALGGDLVLLDDEEGLAKAKDALGGGTAALAFNAVGGESALRLMNLLREGGTHFTFGAMAKRPLSVPNGLLIFRDLQLRGLWVTRWIENAPDAEVRAVYADLAARVAAGALLQPVDSTHTLDTFQAALGRLTAPLRAGKVLFTP
ncbi:MAG: 2-enoyl thioester reductase domain-containing protein [Akkermansiaceae bacterium]|nr:2-enoyl thioester reductase domain-containing protein [Akkermansiaceae bacterium]MCF7731193.1 2-enoyl thioester reductase domain-containing protein [Akkermansiaceae bacterium]